MKLQRTTIAAGVAAALTVTAMPSSAAIFGVASEGLLVPLFVSDWNLNTNSNGYDSVDITNSRLYVTVPSSIGYDGVPNIYTASSSTPTNPYAWSFPPYEIFQDWSTYDAYPQLKWYWFDIHSKKQRNGQRPVTPDDVEVFDADDMSIPQGELGYLVVSTYEVVLDRTANAPFTMFGAAWATIEEDRGTVTGILTESVELPVLGLTDQADGNNNKKFPINSDNIVHFSGSAHPRVSPLVTGIRMNVTNGNLAAQTVFDLPIAADRDDAEDAWHYVWLDQERGVNRGQGDYSCGVGFDLYIFDTEEESQSASGCLPHELNEIYYDSWNVSDDFPDLDLDSGEIGGYAQYKVFEYQDVLNDTTGAFPPNYTGPQASGYAFAILRLDEGEYTMVGALERGMFEDGCGLDDEECENAVNQP
jgi:hypothetical protein